MIKDDFFIEETTTTEPDYETERNKPLPNRIHGRIQTRLVVQLENNYGTQFAIESEVSLDTKPKTSTPDICIFPLRKLHLNDIQAKSTEMPLTTIEIQSPSQSPEDLVAKALEYYFPAGVKSAWVIVPAMKAVRLILPDGQNFLFIAGEVNDPTNGVRVAVEKIFEGVEW
ncbi:MAG: Uma2 family endonuclease [Saprospiraceae bacterium]|nr:Uma2 family endonuclease [Saprospiraceae bacterium]